MIKKELCEIGKNVNFIPLLSGKCGKIRPKIGKNSNKLGQR